MHLALHCAFFLAALLGAFALGKLSSRRRPAALALSTAAALGIIAYFLLIHRQDLLVRMARPFPSLCEQLLLLEAWWALPVVLILAALSPFLPNDRDRRAARALLGLVATLALIAPLALAFWPHDELGVSAGGEMCRQKAGYSCGAASAVNFLREGAGIEASEREMARACGVLPLRGVTMAGAWWGVEKKLREKGLHAILIRPGFDALLRLRPPAMISIRHMLFMDHVVVFLGVQGDLALIADPSQGKVPWTVERLRRKWLGEAIVLDRK